MTMPGSAPFTPPSNDPVLSTVPSSWTSLVASPKSQTLSSRSWAYQSNVSSTVLASRLTVSWTTTDLTPMIILVSRVTSVVVCCRPSGVRASYGIDSSTAAGRMMIGVLGSLAEYERELTKERTALKRATSRANGTRFGRPRKVENSQDIATAKRMKSDGHSVRDIAKYLGVSRATLYWYLIDAAGVHC